MYKRSWIRGWSTSFHFLINLSLFLLLSNLKNIGASRDFNTGIPKSRIFDNYQLWLCPICLCKHKQLFAGEQQPFAHGIQMTVIIKCSIIRILFTPEERRLILKEHSTLLIVDLWQSRATSNIDSGKSIEMIDLKLFNRTIQ